MDTVCQNYKTDPTLNMYYNGCTTCTVDQPTSGEPLTDDYKEKSNMVMWILVSLTIGIILYFVYVRYVGYEQTFFSRVRSYYGNSFSQLTFAVIGVYLAGDLMSSLNSTVLYPIINSLIPLQDNVWNNPICLPRGEFMLPGRFFKSLVTFIISGALIFILIELVAKLYQFYEFMRNKIIKTDKGKGSFTQFTLLVIVSIVVIYLIVGNSLELQSDDIKVFKGVNQLQPETV